MNKRSYNKLKKGGLPPFEYQVAFNLLAIVALVGVYDNFLKDKYFDGKTIDELVGLD